MASASLTKIRHSCHPYFYETAFVELCLHGIGLRSLYWKVGGLKLLDDSLFLLDTPPPTPIFHWKMAIEIRTLYGMCVKPH